MERCKGGFVRAIRGQSIAMTSGFPPAIVGPAPTFSRPHLYILAFDRKTTNHLGTHWKFPPPRKESCPAGLPKANYGTVSEAGHNIGSLRQGRSDNRLLEWALVLSLLFHLAAWGGYELGKRLGWWDHSPVMAWLHKTLHLTPPPKPAPQPPPQPQPELQFVEVAQPDAEPPKNAKYYSNNNSHAANPDPNHDQDAPKLNGTQTDVPKTMTARRSEMNPTPPQPQPKPAKEQDQPAQPQPTLKPGDLTEGKPQEAQEQPQPPQPPRPRTLKEARALQPNQIAGVQMRQDGGAHRAAIMPSFDAEATPFGDYDAKFVQAVTQKWYDLLDSQGFARDRSGRVTLHFNLNYDGSITEVTQLDNTVGPLYGYLCQQALTAPAPYAKWPEEMRRLIGGNVREMTFTFFYY